MGQIVEWEAERARAVIGRHRGRLGSMLPILHDLQEEFGCVGPEAIPILAEALNLSRAEVHGVVTFYHDYRRLPPGRHVVKLCQAEACQAMGSRDLARHAIDSLGIGLGGTTTDRRVTLEAVYCLGLCATAPSAMVDGRIMGRVTPGRLDRALERLT